MWRKIVFGIVLCFPLAAHAQSGPIDALFSKYNGREGYTTVMVSRSMFELFSTMADDKDDKEFKDITKRLSGIRIISCDCKAGTSASQDFYKEMARAVSATQYQDLMDINDGGEQVKFVIRKQGDRISELVMVAGGGDACLISLQGDIDLKQMSRLSKSMNIKGMEHLNSVGQKKK
jgi:Domain of unknown function (DUF4252)